MQNGWTNKQKEIDWIIKPSLHCQAHWLVTQKADTRPKPAKELANPNARADRKIKHEDTTRYIKHLAGSTNFKDGTFNIHRNGLIGNSFEMPNVSYTQTLWLI